MTIKAVHEDVKLQGLSSDAKPGGPNGATFHVIDTGEIYVCHENVWERDLRLEAALSQAEEDTALYSQVATGAGNIAVTVSPAGAYALESISIHLSDAGAANNLTVTLDAAAGSAYDAVLLTQDMTSVTNLLWQPERPIECADGDMILIAWTNGSTRTYGMIVKWSGR